MSDDIVQQLAEWLSERPAELYPLIRRFPPGCTVRGLRSFVVPAPGKTALVTSYLEPDDGHPAGMLGVDGETVFMGVLVHSYVSPDEVVIAEPGKCTPTMMETAFAAIGEDGRVTR